MEVAAVQAHHYPAVGQAGVVRLEVPHVLELAFSHEAATAARGPPAARSDGRRRRPPAPPHGRGGTGSAVTPPLPRGPSRQPGGPLYAPNAVSIATALRGEWAGRSGPRRAPIGRRRLREGAASVGGQPQAGNGRGVMERGGGGGGSGQGPGPGPQRLGGERGEPLAEPLPQPPLSAQRAPWGAAAPAEGGREPGSCAGEPLGAPRTAAGRGGGGGDGRWGSAGEPRGALRAEAGEGGSPHGSSHGSPPRPAAGGGLTASQPRGEPPGVVPQALRVPLVLRPLQVQGPLAAELLRGPQVAPKQAPLKMQALLEPAVKIETKNVPLTVLPSDSGMEESRVVGLRAAAGRLNVKKKNGKNNGRVEKKRYRATSLSISTLVRL